MFYLLTAKEFSSNVKFQKQMRFIMAGNGNLNRVYGVGGPIISVLPAPILAQREPASTDTQYPKGQLWIDESASPAQQYTYVGGGSWQSGGNAMATTTTAGIVTITDNSDPVATKVYVDAIAIAGSPVATDSVAGIGQLATNAEAVAGTPSTGLLALFVTPSNLSSVFAAPPVIGGTTPAAATFTDLTATGTISVSSAAPITIDVTGAGNDLTLSSDAGRVIVNGEEAAANAITLVSAAGGIDADAALQINIASSQNAADAIVFNASAGGIDMTAAGAAGEDIDLVCTSGSINLTAGESIATSMVFTNNGMDIVTSGAAGRDIDITNTGGSINIIATENNAGAIIVQANGGASERITLLSSQGTGADSINLESTAGGITLSSALASADAINLAASAGGVDIDGALQVNIASSQNAVDAVRIVASAGGIDIDAVGAATEDINITNTGGSVVLVATESVADAIRMNASGVAGGFDIDSGTNGFIVDTTGAVSLDSAAASNFTVTGAFDLSLISSAGSVNVTAGEDAADAIVLSAGAGGIDILATGAAGQDIDIANTGGSVNISATENDAGAIAITANGGISERITVTSSQGTGAASVGLTSTAGGITLTAGLATADAINIVASNAAGGIDIDAGTAGFIVDTTGGISLDAAAACNFTATGAFDITVQSTAGSVIVSASEDAADAVQVLSTAGGIDILATGAAGQDIDIVNTGGSVNITGSESAADAVVITASGAAGGISLAAGTGAVNCNTDFNLSSVATKFSMNGGAATDFIGRATLVAGTVTVANTNIAAGDRIFVTRSALNGSPALGFPITTISAGASFTIAAYSAAGAAVATDVSTFDYFIVRQT